MPVDYKSAVYGAILALFRANSGVTAAFPAGNIHDDSSSGAARRRMASSAPQDRSSSLDVEIIGGDEQATRTPNFGLTGPAVVVTDAIVPVSLTVRVRMKFLSENGDVQTSAERYVRQALHQGYPKLGLSYVRDFTTREQRIPGDQNKAEKGITQVDLTLAVTMRLHISQLRD